MKILSVKESVVEHLRTQIIIGELVPGQKLNELELSSSLGISRPPLREAFRVLENEHLVVSTPRKGVSVSELSIEGLREVFQARVMIECWAIDLLKAGNIRDLPHVESALAFSSTLSIPSYAKNSKEEMLRYLEDVVAYHRKLVDATNNRWLIHFYSSIHANLARYQFVYTHIPGQSYDYKKRHKEILSLIKKGDYEKAKKHLRSHINSVVDILENNINRKTQSQPKGKKVKQHSTMVRR